MKFQTILISVILATAPTFASAQGCESDHGTTQASSCAEGLAWDSVTAKCVEQVSS